MIREHLQEKIGMLKDETETLDNDVKGLKEEVYKVNNKLGRLEERVEAQGTESDKAHNHLRNDIAELKSYMVWFVKVVLGAIVTAVLTGIVGVFFL